MLENHCLFHYMLLKGILDSNVNIIHPNSRMLPITGLQLLLDNYSFNCYAIELTCHYYQLQKLLPMIGDNCDIFTRGIFHDPDKVTPNQSTQQHLMELVHPAKISD